MLDSEETGGSDLEWKNTSDVSLTCASPRLCLSSYPVCLCWQAEAATEHPPR